MNKTINIPIDLMKRYRKDKAKWELFTFAVCIKMTSSDSKISTDIKDIRKLLGCSYYKACRMLERAKANPELFHFYENSKYVIATSFTHGKLDKRKHKINNKEYTAYRKTCIRYQYDDSEKVSHIAVSRALRDSLITNAIKVAQQTDGSRTITSSPRPSDSRPLSLVSMAKASGYHRSTVAIHLRKMMANKKVDCVKGDHIAVVHLESGEVLTDDDSFLRRRVYYDYAGIRYVRQPNRYTLVNPCKGDYAINIIFNHKNRHKKNVSALPKRRDNESPADFINRTTLAYLWN